MNHENQSQPFTEATGYATGGYYRTRDEYGDPEIRNGDRFVTSTLSGAVDELNSLANEIRRLRSELDLVNQAAIDRAEYCAKLKGEAHDSKGWMKRAKDAEKAWMALRVEVERLKSHNNGVTPPNA